MDKSKSVEVGSKNVANGKDGNRTVHSSSKSATKRKDNSNRTSHQTKSRSWKKKGKTKPKKPTYQEILSDAHTRSMKEEQDELKSLSCRTWRNPRVFTAVVFLIVFAKSYLETYFIHVFSELQDKFGLREKDLEFAVGTEKIGFVLCLIVAAYYGRNTHRPVVIFFGCWLCAIGSMISWIPYFTSDVKLKVDADDPDSPMITYLRAGLCLSGGNSSGVGSYQCDHVLPVSQDRGAFSLLCFGKFLVGLGFGMYASLSLIYLHDATQHWLPLLLGVILSASGLGEFVAAIMSWQLTTYKENLKGRITFSEWEVGSWWLALPIGAGLLVTSSFLALFFPKWLTTPRWLALRRRRRLRRLEVHLNKMEEAERKAKERRRRKRRKQKLKEKKARKARENHDSKEQVKSGSAKTRDFEAENPEGGAAAVTTENNYANADEVIIDYENENSNYDSDNETADTGKNESDDDDNEYCEITEEERNTLEDLGAETSNDLSAAKVLESEAISVSEDVQKSLAVSKDSKHISFSNQPDDVIHLSDPNEEVKPKTSGTKLGRQFKHIPENMWFLLKQPMFSLAALACGASAYLESGFHRTLPKFMDAYFYVSSKPHLMVSGVGHGLGRSFGAIIGGLIVWRFTRKSQSEGQGVLLKVIMVALGIHCVMLCFMLPSDCNTFSGLTNSSKDDIFEHQCNAQCDCEGVQKAPVCTQVGQYVYPSACHAGCRHVTLDDVNNDVLYTACSCAPHGTLSSSFCETSCSSMPIFMSFYTLAVLMHSTAHVAVITYFLSIASTKLKSLSLGLAIWIITLLSLPGISVFDTIADGVCLASAPDCRGEDVCWLHDASPYKYGSVGAIIGFQLFSLLCFILIYFCQPFFKRSGDGKAENNSTERKNENAENGVASGHVDGVDVEVGGVSNNGFSPTDDVLESEEDATREENRSEPELVTEL